MTLAITEDDNLRSDSAADYRICCEATSTLEAAVVHERSGRSTVVTASLSDVVNTLKHLQARLATRSKSQLIGTRHRELVRRTLRSEHGFMPPALLALVAAFSLLLPALHVSQPSVGPLAACVFRQTPQCPKLHLSPPSPTFPAADSVAKVDRALKIASHSTGISLQLLRAVAMQESAFVSNAVSSAGAVGVLQLTVAAAADCGLDDRDRYNTTSNITCGARHLANYLARYRGNLVMSLAAYNWGPGNLARLGLTRMPQETRDYLRAILPRVTS
jgi:hypothetical protein